MKEIMQTTCFGHMDIVFMFYLVIFLMSYLLFLLQDRLVNLGQWIFAFLNCLLLNSHRSYLLCLPCTAFTEVLSKVQRNRGKPPASLLPAAAHQARGAHLKGERTASTSHLAQPSEQDTATEEKHNGSPNMRTVPRSGSSPMTAAGRWGKGQGASFTTQRGICTILCHPETNTVVALKTNQMQRPIFQEHSWQRGESLKKMNFHLSDAKALGFFFLVTRLCSDGDFKLQVPNFRPTESNLRKKVENPP